MPEAVAKLRIPNERRRAVDTPGLCLLFLCTLGLASTIPFTLMFMDQDKIFYQVTASGDLCGVKKNKFMNYVDIRHWKHLRCIDKKINGYQHCTIKTMCVNRCDSFTGTVKIPEEVKEQCDREEFYVRDMDPRCLQTFIAKKKHRNVCFPEHWFTPEISVIPAELSLGKILDQVKEFLDNQKYLMHVAHDIYEIRYRIVLVNIVVTVICLVYSNCFFARTYFSVLFTIVLFYIGIASVVAVAIYMIIQKTTYVTFFQLNSQAYWYIILSIVLFILAISVINLGKISKKIIYMFLFLREGCRIRNLYLGTIVISLLFTFIVVGFFWGAVTLISLQTTIVDKKFAFSRDIMDVNTLDRDDRFPVDQPDCPSNLNPEKFPECIFQRYTLKEGTVAFMVLTGCLALIFVNFLRELLYQVHVSTLIGWYYKWDIGVDGTDIPVWTHYCRIIIYNAGSVFFASILTHALLPWRLVSAIVLGKPSVISQSTCLAMTLMDGRNIKSSVKILKSLQKKVGDKVFNIHLHCELAYRAMFLNLFFLSIFIASFCLPDDPIHVETIWLLYIINIILVIDCTISVNDAFVNGLYPCLLKDLDKNDGSSDRPYYMTKTIHTIFVKSDKMKHAGMIG